MPGPSRPLSMTGAFQLRTSPTSEAKIKVHTINNEVIEFVKPAQGFVLPVSVVQVYATDTEGGISNLVALS